MTLKSMDEFIAALPDVPSEPVVTPPASSLPGEPAAQTAAAPPDKEAVIRALMAGDLEVVAEFFELDPAKLDKKARKWAVQQAKIAAADSARVKAEQRAAELEKGASPLEALDKAVKGGDYSGLFDILAARFNDSPDALLTKAVRARAVKDPRAETLAAKVAEYEAREQTESAKGATTAEQAYVNLIRDETPADHDVRKIPGWAKKVAKTVKASIDPAIGEPRLSVRQAASRVLRKERERFDARAAVFGGAVKPEPKPDPLARAHQPTRGDGAGKMTREQFFAQFK